MSGPVHFPGADPAIPSEEFIALAVRSHKPLVTCLRECLLVLRELSDEAGDHDRFNEGGSGYEAISEARSLLRKIEP